MLAGEADLQVGDTYEVVKRGWPEENLKTDKLDLRCVGHTYKVLHISQPPGDPIATAECLTCERDGTGYKHKSGHPYVRKNCEITNLMRNPVRLRTKSLKRLIEDEGLRRDLVQTRTIATSSGTVSQITVNGEVVWEANGMDLDDVEEVLNEVFG